MTDVEQTALPEDVQEVMDEFTALCEFGEPGSVHEFVREIARGRLEAEAESAELRQRDKVISRQLERVANGYDPLTKDLRLRLESAEAKLAEAERQRDHAMAKVSSLGKFAARVMEAWPDGDVDGGDLQDMAGANGLLRLETRTEPCGENCSCTAYYGDFPVECYRKTELLLEVEASVDAVARGSASQAEPTTRAASSSSDLRAQVTALVEEMRQKVADWESKNYRSGHYDDFGAGEEHRAQRSAEVVTEWADRLSALTEHNSTRVDGQR